MLLAIVPAANVSRISSGESGRSNTRKSSTSPFLKPWSRIRSPIVIVSPPPPVISRERLSRTTSVAAAWPLTKIFRPAARPEPSLDTATCTHSPTGSGSADAIEAASPGQKWISDQRRWPSATSNS